MKLKRRWSLLRFILMSERSRKKYNTKHKTMDFDFHPQQNNLSWNNLPAKKHYKSGANTQSICVKSLEKNEVGRTPRVKILKSWEVH